MPHEANRWSAGTAAIGIVLVVLNSNAFGQSTTAGAEKTISKKPATAVLTEQKPGFRATTIQLIKDATGDDINIGVVVMDIGEVTEGPLFPVKVSGKRARPITVTLCEILTNPERFNGKILSVNGQIVIGFESFELLVPRCGGEKIGAVWLEYGKGPKRQPTTWCCGDMVPRDPLALVQNDEFRKFHRYLTAQNKTRGCHAGQCYKYEVTATLSGRFDSIETKRCPDGKSECCEGGFGHLGTFCGRIVIQSVSDVVAKPIVPLVN